MPAYDQQTPKGTEGNIRRYRINIDPLFTGQKLRSQYKINTWFPFKMSKVNLPNKKSYKNH